MSKKKNPLFAKTSPEKLRDVGISTFLAFFVFIGSFAVADAAMFLMKGESALSASAFRCSSGWNCLEEHNDYEDNYETRDLDYYSGTTREDADRFGDTERRLDAMQDDYNQYEEQQRAEDLQGLQEADRNTDWAETDSGDLPNNTDTQTGYPSGS